MIKIHGRERGNAFRKSESWTRVDDFSSILPWEKRLQSVNIQGQEKGKGKSSLIEVMHGITQLM